MRNLILLIALFSGGALAQPAATGQFLLRIEPTRPDFTLQNMTAEESRIAMQHAQYLMSLLDSGKLSLAAQVFDPKGIWGIVIVNAPDRETARTILDADPMVKANMFRGEVLPLRVVVEKPAEPAKPAVSVDLKTLESYSGTYNSDQFPLKAVSATQFEFALAGVVVDFDSSSSFTLKQRGNSSHFKKAPAQ